MVKKGGNDYNNLHVGNNNFDKVYEYTLVYWYHAK